MIPAVENEPPMPKTSTISARPSEREREREPDAPAHRARGKRSAPRARRGVARGTGSGARSRSRAGGWPGSRTTGRRQGRRSRRSRGTATRGASAAAGRAATSSEDRDQPERRAERANLREPLARRAGGEDHLRDAAVDPPRGRRRGRHQRSRGADVGARAGSTGNGASLTNSKLPARCAYTSRRERDVAQPGQSAAFGRRKPSVRIRPSRLELGEPVSPVKDASRRFGGSGRLRPSLVMPSTSSSSSRS